MAQWWCHDKSCEGHGRRINDGVEGRGERGGGQSHLRPSVHRDREEKLVRDVHAVLEHGGLIHCASAINGGVRRVRCAAEQLVAHTTRLQAAAQHTRPWGGGGVSPRRTTCAPLAAGFLRQGSGSRPPVLHRARRQSSIRAPSRRRLARARFRGWAGLLACAL